MLEGRNFDLHFRECLYTAGRRYLAPHNNEGSDDGLQEVR